MGGAVETKMTVGQTVGQNGEDRSALEALIIGHSPAVVQLREMIRRVARSNASVMLCGPSGSGKELVARAIHDEGIRSGKAFSAINCGAIPADLIESELFGHEKGSFTGAHARRIGHFEASEGGTLFLDEIGDMRFDMQVKLLRVLEDRTIVRVGSSEMKKVDVRVISATHQDMGTAIADGRFREDLFFRLGVVVLQVPSLAARVEDIPALIRHFQRNMPGETKCRYDDAALAVLMEHRWPGNVRELRNTIERMVVMTRGNRLTVRDLPAQVREGAATGAGGAGARGELSLEETEKQLIIKALRVHGGNRTKAAAELGISRRTLHRKLNEYGLHEKEEEPGG